MTSLAYLFLFICLFVSAAAYQTQTGWLYLIGACGLGLLVIGWAQAWQGLRGVGLRPLPVPPSHQGGTATLRVAVVRDRPGTSHGLQLMLPPKEPRRMFGWWRGSLVPETWQAHTLLDVNAQRAGQASFTLPTERRGEFPLPALRLQSAYPLGLVALTRRVALQDRYLVYPVGPRVADLPWLAPSGEAAGEQHLQDDRQGLMIRGVREYRPGDAWRSIHWRTTARLGQPHVRESEREQGDALLLMLDLRRSAHTPETIEHMITVAASMVAFCQEHGRPVKLFTQPEAEPAPGAPAGFEERAWLARAQATAAEPPQGPRGAVLLSPTYVPGWQHWASHFVYCPGEATNALDATVYCPVGAAIAETLGAERRP